MLDIKQARKLVIIGSINEPYDVIKAFADEHSFDVFVPIDVLSYSSFKRAVDYGSDADVIILDILSCQVDDDDFKEGVRYLNSKHKGTVIVYAPGTFSSSSKLEICTESGFDNIIRDVLTARIKSNLEKTIKFVSNTNKTTLDDTGSASKQKMIGSSVPDINPAHPDKHKQTMVEKHLVGGHTDKDANTISSDNTDESTTTPEVIVTKKIGVIGVLPRIGVTTQALMILNTLRSQNKTACYIQNNDSSFINDMENFFTGVEKNHTKGCLVYEGVDYYKNPNLALSQSYQYHVKDYGACINPQVPPEFFNNDIRVIICGGTAEEVSRLTALRNQLYMDNDLIYIFSFVADYEREDILDLMGEKSNIVGFAPYTPDSYKITEESKNMYLPIFGFSVEEKKRKSPFGFIKRKR